MLFLLYRTVYILQRVCPFSLTVSSCLLKKMNSINVIVMSVPTDIKMNISY